MKLTDIVILEDMHSDLDPRKFNPDKGRVKKVYTWNEFKSSLPDGTKGVDHKESKTNGTVSIAYAQPSKIGRLVITGVFNHKDGYGEVLA